VPLIFCNQFFLELLYQLVYLFFSVCSSSGLSGLINCFHACTQSGVGIDIDSSGNVAIDSVSGTGLKYSIRYSNSGDDSGCKILSFCGILT